MKKHQISTKFLSIEKVTKIIDRKQKIELSEEAIAAVKKCRDYLDTKAAKSAEPIYGVTTGFGSLCNKHISAKDLSTLQRNLVISHACGVGEEVPQEIVQLMLLLKVQSLSYGHSGVQLDTIQRLVDFYNKGVYPVVYQQGSLGASGDFAEINEKFGWQPITLKSKEGLALLNGTQFMSSYAVWLLMKARKLSWLADIIGTISLEAFDGRIEPFNMLVHLVRPHSGQIITAAHITQLLEGSEIIAQHKEHVQDPYSFRCMPQVHGASKDAIEHVQNVVETEINSVTDNPTVFPDEDIIVSAGNFHGQPLALVLDFLSIAMAELGNISERRIYQLISGKRGLPSFLVKNPGLNSGFMIPQYAAASIVNQNKAFTMPCSTDSIESSQGQEDKVLLGGQQRGEDPRHRAVQRRPGPRIPQTAEEFRIHRGVRENLPRVRPVRGERHLHARADPRVHRLHQGCACGDVTLT